MALLDSIVWGTYIGVLTGVFAAVIVYTLTFTFTYLAGAKLSINYALMIGLGVAGIAGGPRLLMRNPEILQSGTSLVMLLLVLLISFYAHRKAQDLGEALPPKEVALRKLRRRALAPGVVRQIGQFGQVEIRPTGEVDDVEGYPPLPEATRRAIRGERWTFPADLPISELERRLAETLRNDYDLADVVVVISADGRASIGAAPPIGGLSRRVPPGRQAVTVDAILPGGIAEGDETRLTVGGETVTGRVISLQTEDGATGTDQDLEGASANPAGDDADDTGPGASGERAGGNGRVALSVDPRDVGTVVGREPEKLYVRSRGQGKEYELVSMLRRHDSRFRKVTLRPEGAFVDRTLGDLDFRNAYGVVVLAIKRAEKWRFAPGASTRLRAEDELFVAGPESGLERVRETLA